jgi:SAM-dependent methyltransferase
MSWQERWLDRFYRSQPRWIDGTTEFHRLCARHIATGARILEIGAGPPNPTSAFLSSLGELHGVDPGAEIRSNGALAQAHVIDGDAYPYGDATFDAAVSNYVVEHVADPVAHLSEVKRVLRSGGVYIFRTTNVIHYVGLVAAMTPHWFHRLVANRLRNLPADAHDPWPTTYRMNTRRSVYEHAERAGLLVRSLSMVEKDPYYGRAARPLFAAMLGYERLVNSTEMLATMRANIFAVLAS